MVCISTNYTQNRVGSHGSNRFLCLRENLGYIHCNHYNLCRTMNTTQQTIMIDSNSDCILDSDMANLLQMTNDLLLKIKQQLMEKTL